MNGIQCSKRNLVAENAIALPTFILVHSTISLCTQSRYYIRRTNSQLFSLVIFLFRSFFRRFATVAAVHQFFSFHFSTRLHLFCLSRVCPACHSIQFVYIYFVGGWVAVRLLPLHTFPTYIRLLTAAVLLCVRKLHMFLPHQFGLFCFNFSLFSFFFLQHPCFVSIAVALAFAYVHTGEEDIGG